MADSSINNTQTQSLPITTTSEPHEVPPHHSKTEGNGQNNNDSIDDQARTSSDDDPPSQPQLPIEYQLYEVDLTNPDMDPLEYTFRKYVSVPKAYFWDTASETNDYNQSLPFSVKFWHRSIYYLGECLKKAEAGGEMVANFLGLNSGPFDYVTNNMTEGEMARSREIVEERREEQVEVERRKEGFV